MPWNIDALTDRQRYALFGALLVVVAGIIAVAVVLLGQDSTGSSDDADEPPTPSPSPTVATTDSEEPADESPDVELPIDLRQIGTLSQDAIEFVRVTYTHAPGESVPDRADKVRDMATDDYADLAAATVINLYGDKHESDHAHATKNRTYTTTSLEPAAEMISADSVIIHVTGNQEWKDKDGNTGTYDIDLLVTLVNESDSWAVGAVSPDEGDAGN